MKRNIILGLIATACLSVSCAGFLEEDPKGRLLGSNIFENAQDIDMSMSGLYRVVSESQQNTNPLYLNWQGDDITANPGSNKQACAEIDAFNVSNDNKAIVGGHSSWVRFYNIIRASNTIINNIEGHGLNEEQVKIAKGNALFWRAYAYFYLVRFFGPLPVNLTNVQDSYTTPLTDEAGIYELVIKDLKEAESLLPYTYTTEPAHKFGVDFYTTVSAVRAGLAAVYMHMAGWPLNKKEMYAEAAKYAKMVIDDNEAGKTHFELEKDWFMIYPLVNNYSKEVVLGISNSLRTDWSGDSQWPLTSLFESAKGWGDLMGELKFWKEMPAGPRKQAIYHDSIRVDDTNFITWLQTSSISERRPMFAIFTMNKGDFLGMDVTHKFNEMAEYNLGRMINNHYHRVIRYSEIVLWYAECAARAGQAVDGRYRDLLTEVVNRAYNAGMAPVIPAGGEALAEFCYQQHGWEVAGYPMAMVTRRQDQFRMDRLKETFESRKADHGYYDVESKDKEGNLVVVKVAKSGEPITVTPEEVAFTIQKDTVVYEKVVLPNKTWNQNLMYMPYPSDDSAKNMNLVRK